jgi:hypothetical protein
MESYMREIKLAWCDETLVAMEPLERKEAKATRSKRKRESSYNRGAI